MNGFGLYYNELGITSAILQQAFVTLNFKNKF